MRFDRARAGDHGCANCADETTGHLVLPDARALLWRLGGGRYAGWKARSRARGGARDFVSQGAAGALENRVWDRYGRNSVDGTDCAGIRAHGFAGDDADG